MLNMIITQNPMQIQLSKNFHQESVVNVNGNIPQYDGNVTLPSAKTDDDPISDSVDKVVSLDPELDKSKNVNNKNTLPTIGVANLRSLKPKINSVSEKMRNEDIEVLLINEVWEPENNGSFQKSLQNIYEMKGSKQSPMALDQTGKEEEEPELL